MAVVTAVLPVPAAGEPDGDEPAADNPLTTKEGWRRFVDTEPSPPVLLDATALSSLDAAQRAGYDEARIDYHAGLPLVNTPVIRQVISTSRLLIQLNRHQVSARRGVVISGASGTGKTTGAQPARPRPRAGRPQAAPRRPAPAARRLHHGPPGGDPADGGGGVRPVLRAARAAPAPTSPT